MKRQISIVIICYNDYRIFDCLNCLLSQTTKTIEREIIVVLVPNAYLEKKLGMYQSIKLYFAPRGNLSRSRNIGIKHSAFDRILLLDSDIILSDHFLEEILKASDDYDLVKSNIIFDSNSWLTSIIAKSRKLGHVGNVFTPGLLVKKEVFDRIGYFNEKVKFSEDGEFSFRVKKKGVSFTETSRACVFHPPINLKRDLRMAYNLGIGKRSGVEFGQMLNSEDLSNLSHRFFTGILAKDFVKKTKEWGLAVAVYDTIWAWLYYLGYYHEKYKGKQGRLK